MSGNTFFKVAWDALGTHLPADYVSTFEPDAGLPPIKGMLSQTQGGSTCATNARRWCVHYLYASLKRIEELEALACCQPVPAGKLAETMERDKKGKNGHGLERVANLCRAATEDSEALGVALGRVKKLEDDLSAAKKLLESRGQDMDGIMTLLADVQSGGSIIDRINYLLDKNRELSRAAAKKPTSFDEKADPTLAVASSHLNLIRSVLLEADRISIPEGTGALEDDVKALAIGVRAMGASLTSARKEIDQLYTSCKRSDDTLRPILLAAWNVIYPKGGPHDVVIGAPDVIRLLEGKLVPPSVGSFKVLSEQLRKSKASGQTYYAGWKGHKDDVSPEGLRILSYALASLQQAGVALPYEVVETPSGQRDEGDVLRLTVALLDRLKPDSTSVAGSPAPVQEAPVAAEPALDPKVTIQTLETELAQLKDQMLTDEHASLELQNKLASVANSRDSLNRELTATWDLLPDELQGMRTSLPEAIASLLRIWTANEDKVKELMDKVVLNVERRHILLAYLTKLFPSTIMHEPKGPDYPWNLRFTTPHGTFSARVSDKHYDLFRHTPVVTEQEGDTLGLYNAMKQCSPMFARRWTKEDQDHIAHLQDTIRDLTTELQSRPKASSQVGTIRVGDHALTCRNYHVDGKLGQLPSTLTFMSDETDEARRPISPEGAPGIAPPLQATYIREDVALAQEEKPSIAAAAPLEPATPQDQIAQTVSEMVCNLLDREHERSDWGGLHLEWVPERAKPCSRDYNGYESGSFTLASAITLRPKGMPQEGAELTLDTCHLTVLLAWEGAHPAAWKQGLVPLVVNKTI